MLLIAWTTLASREEAETMAREIVEAHLAVCVQVEGPIASYYIWDGRLEQAQEFRLCIKLIPELATQVEAWVLDHHPYETPEWVSVRAENVSEKYLSWARANSSTPPL